MNAHIDIEPERLQEFCRRWKITEFALFGSVLQDDFGPDSDVDVLISFADEAHWTFFDLAHMQSELENQFGRPVDVVTRRGVESSRNYLRREAILASAEKLDVA